MDPPTETGDLLWGVRFWGLFWFSPYTQTSRSANLAIAEFLLLNYSSFPEGIQCRIQNVHMTKSYCLFTQKLVHSLHCIRCSQCLAIKVVIKYGKTAAYITDYIDRVNWRHTNLWSQYNTHVIGHDVLLCEANWWRFVTLFLNKIESVGLRKAFSASARSVLWL